MQSTSTLVVLGSVVLFVLLGVMAMLTRSDIYDEIGHSGLSIGENRGQEPAYRFATDEQTREQEIRQMLQARSERLERHGGRPLDIDAELAKLEQAHAAEDHDPSLTMEVRQLVLARNQRRLREGQPPLDVEQEVTRTLRELG